MNTDVHSSAAAPLFRVEKLRVRMARRIRLTGVLVSAAVTGMLLASCAGGNGSGAGSSSAKEDLTIGVVFYDKAAPNTAPLREAIREVADKNGVKVITTDSKSDVGKERADVEDLITRGADAIILQPIDGEVSQQAAKLANNASIPLFTLNTGFPEQSDVKIVSHIGQDETEAGKMQAQYLNEALPEGGQIIFVAGTYGASWTDRRRDGYDSAINKNISIAAEYQADCSRDKGRKGMEDMLQRFQAGSLVGAYAQCDETAIGASLAIEEAARKDDFKAFVSVDGDPAGFEAVRQGVVTATVAQDFRGQGQKAAEAAIAHLEGQKVEPEIVTPALLVTGENVEQYIK